MRTAEYDLQRFFNELHRDFSSMGNGEVFFFTNEMTDEYIHLAVEKCLEEIAAAKRRQTEMDEYEFAWSK